MKQADMIFSRRNLLLSGSALVLIGCERSSSQAVENAASEGAESIQALDLSEDDREIVELMMLQFSEDPADEGKVNADTAAIQLELAAFASSSSTLRDMAKKEILGSEVRYFDWTTDDRQSFDHFHLVNMGDLIETETGDTISTEFDQTPFTITPALLRRMAAANYFDFGLDSAPEGADNRVIVALRGCEIERTEPGFQDSAILKDSKPDHRSSKCVMIVWLRQEDPETDKIAVFPGSTVPSELYHAIYQQWEKVRFGTRSYRCNMMPQGLHWKKVGNLWGRYPYALRQDSLTPVIREPNDAHDAYTLDHSQWDPEGCASGVDDVHDHLHMAFFGAWRTWQFSSQGCQTIPGTYDTTTDKMAGPIVEFNEAMGFGEYTKVDGAFTGPKYGVRYPFMMLSGREARLHAANAAMSRMRRIRIGSGVDHELPENSEHPILKLQTALGETADGRFGAKSMTCLIAQQRALNQMAPETHKADGVCTPNLAAEFEIDLS